MWLAWCFIYFHLHLRDTWNAHDEHWGVRGWKAQKLGRNPGDRWNVHRREDTWETFSIAVALLNNIFFFCPSNDANQGVKEWSCCSWTLFHYGHIHNLPLLSTRLYKISWRCFCLSGAERQFAIILNSTLKGYHCSGHLHYVFFWRY